MALKLLQYDIRTNSRIPHPTTILHNRALRFQLSCWIIEESRIPWNYLKSLDDEGIGNVWDVIHFADTMSVEVMNILVRNLRRDIEDAEKRANASLERLDEQERNAVDEGDKSRDKRCKERVKVLERSEKLLKGLQEAATLYGIDVNSLPFQTSFSRLTSLRGVNGVRTALAAQLTEMATGTRFEAAAKADEIPVEILADAMEDEGNDTTSIRSAFAETQVATTQKVTSSTDNNTRAIRNPSRQERVTNRNNGTPTTYTVRSRNEVRSVQSTLTSNQAAEICETLEGSFPKDLARRHNRGMRISEAQRAWMHVLAMESLERDNEVAEVPQTVPAVPMTAVAQVTTPQTTGAVIETGKCHYNKETKTLLIDASETGLDGLPATLTLRKQNGNTADFIRTSESYSDEDELISTRYRGPNGLTLEVLND